MVPKGYEGAYEKSLKGTQARVNALSSSPAVTAESPELTETYMWPLISAPMPPKAMRPAPTSTHNRYDDLDDGDEEESEVVKTLAQLTANVQKGSDQSKSQRKRCQSAHRRLDMAHIKSLTQQVINGDMNSPDLNLDNNAEY